MTTLHITRGYSGSGKTTLAKQMVAESNRTLSRVNRDDIRAMLGIPPRSDYLDEQRVTHVQQAAARRLLAMGQSVIIDDTNLVLRFARDWADLAAELGVEFQVWDVTTSLEASLARNERRIAAGERGVPAEVIRSQAQRFPLSQWHPVTAREAKPERAWTPYVEPDGYSQVIYLVDIDGTVAKKQQGEGSRGWHEYDRVGEDRPNWGVIRIVNDLRFAGASIVFMSGRKDYCRPQTRAWLQTMIGHWTEAAPLFMRADDDNRSDDIVKHELFHRHIQGKYSVRGVLDDRDRVVAMWRAIGLTVAQIDYGNF